jgi:hypothetical protein
MVEESRWIRETEEERGKRSEGCKHRSDDDNNEDEWCDEWISLTSGISTKLSVAPTPESEASLYKRAFDSIIHSTHSWNEDFMVEMDRCSKGVGVE